MIKFACPGCSAIFTIGDEKAGKMGRCPKCSTQFEIPGIQPVAQAPAPSAAQAPAPPAIPENEFEIEPCPGCQSKLIVESNHLGLDVECPHCQTVYQAVKVGDLSFKIKKDDPPAFVPKKYNEEIERTEVDDRPRRKRRRLEEDDDDDDDDDESEDRPRRRRRRSSRRTQSATVTTVGIMSLVLGGLSIICSCLMFGFASFAKEINEQGQHNDSPEDVKFIQLLFLVTGISYVIFSVASLIAGYGVLKRLKFGRLITFVSSTFALLGCLASLAIAFGNLMVNNPSGVITGMISALIFGGYGVFALFAMIKHGDEFE